MGTADTLDALEPNWLGVPIAFSGCAAATNIGLLESAGFTIEHAEEHDLEEGDGVARFLWTLARR